MELPNGVARILLTFFLLSHHASSESERSTYIVHMDKTSMPKAFSTHHFWYSSVVKSAKSEAQTSARVHEPDPKLLYTYDKAFHGFSAVMSKDELEALRKSPGFISAYADDVVTLDTTHSYKFLSLNSAAGLWPASQYGKDAIIGVIDSGIWPESPSFSDGGMTKIPLRWKGFCQEGQEFNSSSCNKKIIGARYYNEGYRASFPGRPITMNSARDEDGHGTHVASIAAGNYVGGASFFGYAPGTARGVAPRARLAVYKVIWGGGTSSDVLAGIDQAVADGVDILSISLGSSNTNLYTNPLAIASFGARQKGILVCVSAGNGGPSFGTILSSGIPWVVTVASGTIDRWFAGTFTLGNRITITGWTTFPARSTVRNLPLVYNETLSTCSPTDVANAPGNSIIICNITMGKYDFDSVMSYLPNSNARAAIIIAEDPSIFLFTSFPFPGVVISPTEAQDVIKYASTSANPRASIEFQQTVLGTEPRAAPSLSVDSSRGPSRSYGGILKPDIMAPGVLILAAYNPHVIEASIGNNIFLSSDYTLLSGTSMACPHIAGVAALLKAAHPGWSPAAIQSAMMTTANPLDDTNQPIKEHDNTLATPLGIGSGMVDPNRALDPGLVYDVSVQDLVNLVCSMNFTRQQTQTITRSNYNCSNPSPDLNYPSFIALFHLAERGMTITRKFFRTVTNVGDGAATYNVQLDVPENTRVEIQPRSLVFRKKNEKRSYSLTISFEADVKLKHGPGSLTWVDQTGKYRVRSPIMVSAATIFV